MKRTIIIKKGSHYPFPYFFLTLPKWVNRKKPTSMKRWFVFTQSCLYDFKDVDQHDVNKLFGFSIGLHHNTSFRFGWRPNSDLTAIEIVGYEYQDGKRIPTIPICEVALDKSVGFLLMYEPKGKTTYCVYNGENIVVENNVNIKKKWGLGYILGIYFGGNKPAPHEIEIDKI